jgi:hypothetical protein
MMKVPAMRHQRLGCSIESEMSRIWLGMIGTR